MSRNENSLKVDAARSAQMRLIRSAHTKPEYLVRRALFALGYRYRLHSRHLPGKPDLVFPNRKKVIFVHGCFWHRHLGCKKTRTPKSRLDYWIPKFATNVKRDRLNQKLLLAGGWRFMVIWECETSKIEKSLGRLRRFLGAPRIEK